MLGVEPERPTTAFEIAIREVEVSGGYCQLQLRARPRRGRPSFTVDWGDGSSSTFAAGGSDILWHNYRAAGSYLVEFDQDMGWFRLAECCRVDSGGGIAVVRPDVRPLWWGDWVESASATYSYWSADSFGNLGAWGEPPPWGRSITDVTACYARSRHIAGPLPHWTTSVAEAGGCFEGTGVHGRIPKWPRSMVNPGGCYDSAAGMFGEAPPWPDNAEEASYCYRGLPGVVGPVPPWPDTMRSMQGTFQDCAGLTGRIPKWPAAAMYAQSLYSGCTGLEGAWTEDPAELMPASLRRHWDAVTGASPALRRLFDSEWGGTRDTGDGDGEEEDGVVADVVAGDGLRVERNADGDFVVSLAAAPSEDPAEDAPDAHGGGRVAAGFETGGCVRVAAGETADYACMARAG